MSSKLYEIEVEVARGVPTIIKLFYLASCSVAIYYSIVLENYLSLGGWVLALGALSVYHVIERAAVKYFNEFQLLKSLLQIKMLEIEGTSDNEMDLTKSETQNEDETSTNGE